MRAANIPMRTGLTEAQREACGETIERLGAEELMRAQRQKIRDGFQQITDRARLEQPTTPEGQEWKAAFLELARMVDEQAGQDAMESRRISHALMSVNLAVCQP